jgi:hypothetical protein
LLLGMVACGLPVQQGVTVLVPAPGTDGPTDLELQYRWHDAAHTVPLEHDDGWLQATLPDVDARWLPLELRRRGTPEAAPLYQGVARLPARGRTLRMGWVDEAEPRLAPMSRAEQAVGIETTARGLLGLHMAWTCGMLLVVFTLLRRRDAQPTAPWSLHPAASLLLWIPLATLWTWPAIAAGDSLLVGLHFDLPGTAWSIASAPRLLHQGLQDPLTAFPIGASYARFDSFTLLALAWLTPLLPTGALHGLLQLGGVVAGAWASERTAAAMGAKAPWTLLAGLAYAFSGLAATALLEGHAYQVATPWLPLFLWAWLRALSKDGRTRHVLLAGLAFAATLLTSGYLGVVAAVAAPCLLPTAQPLRLGALTRRAWPAAVIALVTGALYLWLFTEGTLHGSAVPTPDSLGLGSANLASLAGVTPEVDRSEHSLALSLSGVLLALLVVAPALLERRGPWRALLLAGLACLLLAMGPTLHSSAVDPAFPLPTALLWHTPLGQFLRFPARLAWGFLACSGLVAALAGTALEARVGRRARLLVLLALVEPFMLVRLPFRQGSLDAAVPSAYAQAGGAVLELFPSEGSEGAGLEPWMSATSCYYQTTHGHPIAEDCVDPDTSSGPRQRLGAWVQHQLLQGRGEAATAQLEAMGFAALAVHPDLLEPEDLAGMAPALAAMDPRPLTSHDGGELLRLYRIEAGTPPNPAQARAALDAMTLPATAARCVLPSQSSTPGSTGRGRVALMGWGLFALMATGWHLRRRRRR